jgi:hypothetical protein
MEFDLPSISLLLPSLLGTTTVDSSDGENKAEDNGLDTRPSEEITADTADWLVATGNDLDAANDSVSCLDCCKELSEQISESLSGCDELASPDGLTCLGDSPFSASCELFGRIKSATFSPIEHALGLTVTGIVVDEAEEIIVCRSRECSKFGRSATPCFW